VRELSLFSGAGGGLLGTKMLGWNCVGYVEFNEYCQKVLAQRIEDGFLDEAPIFTDVREFIQSGAADQYRGHIDVLTAGFPCQPFSVAGKRRGGETTEICGPKPSRPFAELDHATRCWRTYQVCLLTNTADEYSQTWPKQGLMRDGVCSEQTMWVPRTDAKGSGYWPTPTVSDTEGGIIQNVEERNGSFSRKNAKGERWGVKLKDAVAHTNNGGQLNPTWVEWLMNWPLNWTSLEPLPNENYELWKKASTTQVQHSGDGVRPLWWFKEPASVPRVSSGVSNRTGRLKALGNGQVPAVAAKAWQILAEA